METAYDTAKSTVAMDVPERTGQVREGLKYVDDRLDRLALLVTRLEDTVGPVMGPSDQPMQAANLAPGGCSEVTGALRSLGQRADEIGDRFNTILNRIEV